jgi:hypothetical protein
MIATSRQSASRTKVPTVTQTFWHVFPTNASLAGTPRINFYKLATGPFCLVRDKSKELRPTRIVDGFCQHSGGESFHVQIFHHNHAESIHYLAGFLVVKIGALIPYMRMSPLKQLYCLTATVASLFAACNFALAAPQPSLSVSAIARVLNLRSVREDGERCESYVNPDGFRGDRQRFVFAFNTETDEPPTGFPLDYRAFYFTFQRPMQFDFDVPCSLYANLAGIQQFATVAIVRKGDAIVATSGFETREARRLSGLNAGKKRCECFVEAAEDVLAGARICQREAPVGTHGFEFLALIVITNRFATELPRADPMFKSGVIERARFFQLTSNERLLFGGRVDPVLEGEPVYCYAGFGSGGFVLSHDETFVREDVSRVFPQFHSNTEK